MKNFLRLKTIGLFAILLTVCESSMAQWIPNNGYPSYAAPRWYQKAADDHSYMRLTLNWVDVTFAGFAKQDTIRLNPYTYQTIINATDSLKDTTTIVLSNNYTSFLNDELKIYIQNANGANHIVKFRNPGKYTYYANKWNIAGDSISILTSKQFTIFTFIYNANGQWWEVSKVSR